MARRALLVGINNYPGNGSDLNGCVNDVTNIRDILKTYLGFSNDDIRMLVDDRATKQNIMERLEWMVVNAQPGDYMVFHYSGHGSQVRDRDGDELSDQLDEILCPADMSWDNGYILDDELSKLFGRLPDGCLLEVFLDACHSETGTRGFKPENPHPRKSRYLKPPLDIALRHEGDNLPTKGFRSPTRSTLKHILWSGCKAEQTSDDAYIDNSYNGAFTYYFCKFMRQSQGKVTRRVLLEQVRNALSFNHHSQIPQLEVGDARLLDNYVLQLPPLGEMERTLSLTTPYMRGDDVKRVQQALKNKGYNNMVVDGVFGPRMRDVVMQFQKSKNITANGIVDAGVRKLLFG